MRAGGARWVARLFLFIAVALAWAWVLWKPGGASAPLKPAGVPIDGAAPRLSEPSTNGDLSGGRVIIAPPAPSAVPEPEVEPALHAGIPVQVLRGMTEEPEPFALIDASPDQPASGFEPLVEGWSPKPPDATPRRFRADAAGRALLPAGSVFAACATEAAWGFAELAGAGPHELRLYPDAPLSVRVVDAAGHPLPGAGVALHLFDGEMPSKQRIVTTDPEGRVELRNLRWPLRWYSERSLAAVRLEGVLEPPCLAAFRPRELPLEIELVQPPVTRLDVQVVAEDGTPWCGPALVQVCLASDPYDNDGRRSTTVEARDGRASFERIGLGLAVLVAVSAPGRLSSEIEVQAATAAGETVTVQVPVGLQQLVFVARLTHGGEPLAAREIWVQTAAGSKAETFLLKTDAEGRLRTAFYPYQAKEERISLEFFLPDATPPLLAQTVVSGPFRTGERPLGDLELAPAPCLAAGRVVDELGRPVAGAALVLSRAPLKAVAGSSASDGSFALHGPSSSGLLILNAEDPGHAPASLVITPGAEGVLLTLPATGSIAGSVAVPFDWWCDDLRVSARQEGSDAALSSVNRAGLFRLSGLQAGVYTVSIHVDLDLDAVGRTVPGVEVRAGEVTADARLERVDLGALRHFELHVTDGSGAAIPWGFMYVRESGRPGWPWPAGLYDGLAGCRTLAPQVDVCVIAEGQRAALFENVQSGAHVALEASGLTLMLRWKEPPVEVPEDLVVSQYLEAEEPLWPAYVPPGREEGGADVMELPFPGRYSAVFQCYAGGTERRFRVPVDVADQDGVQEVEIGMPEEMVAFLEEWNARER